MPKVNYVIRYKGAKKKKNQVEITSQPKAFSFFLRELERGKVVFLIQETHHRSGKIDRAMINAGQAHAVLDIYERAAHIAKAPEEPVEANPEQEQEQE